MSNDNEEIEIKIEYMESFEADPLLENSIKQTCSARTNELISSNYSDENINQSESQDVRESLVIQESTIKVGSNDPSVPKNEEYWYKCVDEYGRYSCKFCDHFYSTLRTVRVHCRMKHFEEYQHIRKNYKTRRTKVKCYVCKASFSLLNDLQDHVLKIHGINNIQKSCSLCHAMFDNNDEFFSHVSNEHATGNKKHLCLVCGYSTSKISHFKQHENMHTGNNQKKCPHCGYTTDRTENLKTHVRTHTNQKPYSCSFKDCGYRCATKSALHSHELKHDKKNNLIYCDKCSYSTVYKQSLKKHIDSHRRNKTRTKF